MLTGFLKGLVHGLAWSLATAAAVTLSWWGVHSVMAGTAYDPPRAVPLAAGSRTPDDTAPAPSAPHRPKPDPAPTPQPTTPAPPPPTPETPPKTHPSPPPKPPSTPSDPADGVIRGYDTKGGRVVLDIGKTTASLVSATPRSGWSMQVAKTSTWIRVEFTTDTDKVTLTCNWYEQQPQVQITDG